MPEEVNNNAKLRSPAADPRGTPSRRICVPEAPSNRPVSPLSSRAVRSSFQAVSNCAIVRTWPNSYSRANFNKMFRLRTNARADDRVSPLIFCGSPSVQSSYYTRMLFLGKQASCVILSPFHQHKLTFPAHSYPSLLLSLRVSTMPFEDLFSRASALLPGSPQASTGILSR